MGVRVEYKRPITKTVTEYEEDVRYFGTGVLEFPNPGSNDGPRLIAVFIVEMDAQAFIDMMDKEETGAWHHHELIGV